MPRKLLVSFIVVVSLLFGALFFSAGGRVAYNYLDTSAEAVLSASNRKQNNDRRMVDMIADDSYLIDYGDSTVFILVGNFAAHHNGAVITADSAVRFSNQSFECYGNVLINQNTMYIYGDKAEYSQHSGKATIYSDLIKVVDGDAVMYTYNCTFDTDAELGEFYGGCYVLKGESLMESERGYYNTATHDLIAVDNVEMRDEVYQMTGDSVIFNTETEDAQYFQNTNIWNDKDEYLFANRGSYTKARDLHYLTRDAYLLSPDREVWSDSIEYYRTAGHIIGRGNIQVDDTTQKIIGFADYGEWWDESGNALFTRRPSMINYDPQQPDSLFLCADTLWMYTIAVAPPEVEPQDSTAQRGGRESGDMSTDTHADMGEDMSSDDSLDGDVAEVGEQMQDVSYEQFMIGLLQRLTGNDLTFGGVLGGATAEESVEEFSADNLLEESVVVSNQPAETAKDRSRRGAVGADVMPDQRPSSADMPKTDRERMAQREAHNPAQNSAHDSAHNPAQQRMMQSDAMAVVDTMATDTTAVVESAEEVASVAKQSALDSLISTYASVADQIVAGELTWEQIAADRAPLTEKQMRYRAKLERRRARDAARAEQKRLRDSVNAIKQAKRDSIQHIKDSILNIKLDTIIAQRKARNTRIADEEAARMERIKQQSEERRRRKIDKAKARALKRGKVYTGEDYLLDTLATEESDVSRDTVAVESQSADTMARDTMAQESAEERPFPADSSYKLIKAYRRVKMYRSDSQMICDSMVMLNTDSIIHLYIDPVMWNDTNQITADSMAIHTTEQRIDKVHFMGDPMMSSQIDTTYYNQVKGKDMTALFANGSLYRNNVDGNAQTIYYLQEEENSTNVTALMYIESAAISFYFENGEIDKISYKQNPEYKLYPMDMIPETQKLRLPDFEWVGHRRPVRDSVFMREMRATRRGDASVQSKPRFRITERIDYDRRRLVENGEWEDRVDELLPEVIEWRNSRPSYQNKE